MKKMIYATLCIALLFSVAPLKGQDMLQYPPHVKWKHIKTEHFRVAYPVGFEKQAIKTAQTMESLYQPLGNTLKGRRAPWTILLSNTGAISNGSVSLAPRHAQFYAYPPQANFSGPIDWFDLLAAHEGRHMVQFDILNSGLTRFIGHFTGETGIGAMIMWTTPMWFFEGDAIASETAFSKAGRGRLPEFNMQQRALRLSGKKFDYDKTYLRSYKDYIPNHYVLGYLLVADARHQYSADLFSKINKRTAKFSLNPFRFYSSYSNYTKKYFRYDFYNIMARYDSLWLSQWDNLDFSKANLVSNPQKRSFTSYSFPNIGYKGRLIAYKTGIATTPHVVMLDTATAYEEPIVEIAENEFISAGEKYIAWIDNNVHDRFLNENYADIVVYKIDTKEQKTITKKGRNAWPRLSHHESMIASVFTDSLQNTRIELFDVQTSECTQRIQAGEGYRFRQPSWAPDDKSLLVLRDGPDGVALVKIDLQDDKTETLIPESFENISYPTWGNDLIYYSSPYSGIDNIYAFDPASGNHYQVTSRMFGAFYPFFDEKNNTLYYSDYTADGFQIVKTIADKENWKPKNDVIVKDVLSAYADNLQQQENGEAWIKRDTAEDKAGYTIEPYNTIEDAFNIHSWTINPGLNSLTASITSNNLLNTLSFNMSGGYYGYENTMIGAVGFAYTGLRPVISASFGKTGRNFTPLDSTMKVSGTEFAANFAVMMPSVRTSGIYTFSHAYGAIGGYRDFSGIVPDENLPMLGSQFGFVGLAYNMSYVRQKSTRDLKPKHSFYINAEASHSFKQSKFIDHASASIDYVLPGISRHDVITLEGAVEYQNYRNYFAPAQIVFPRGYEYGHLRDLTKGSVTYEFPIFYPDFKIGPLVYFKRLRGGLFADYAYSFHHSKEFLSVGSEIVFDCNWLSSLQLELPIGYRISYLPLTKSVVHEIVISNVFFKL